MSGKQDAHQGGDLFDMAKDGTKIPGDAGKMNIIPSKAPQAPANDLGSASLNTAAENAAGNVKVVDDAVTGTGDSLPPSIFSKASGSGGK
ncbi:hypothetical protein F4808DRAFT_457953 [Astrocystis sublimbata]|nr:hypothetical protein F4808DRAFT_457953 [Astrocystis sublimbata]